MKRRKEPAMHDLFAALQKYATERPESIAFEEEGRSLTFGALASEVAALAEALPAGVRTVALAGESGLEWIVADLAVTLSGRRLAPLPVFFTALQNAHICQDARVGLVLTCGATRAETLPAGIRRQAVVLGQAPSGLALPGYAGGSERVIYTSGTTGRPKGVLHGDRQLGHALKAIAEASGASAADKHLTALPYALLLEQIVGIFLPVLLGGRAFVSPRAIGAALSGDCRPLLECYFRQKPATTVLTPQLLSVLLLLLQAAGARAPESLRLAALGGAPAAPALIAAGRAAGFPLRQGYGLSEACSVVSLQREGEEETTSCGWPLPGVGVEIVGGEIQVSGPGVMTGYLGQAPLQGDRHATGDLGFFDAEGRLHVTGRKDRVMVLANGRNLSPEWLESAILADPLFSGARAEGHGEARPGLQLLLRPQVFERLKNAPPDALKQRVARLLYALPDYAQPDRVELRFSENGPILLSFRLADDALDGSLSQKPMEATTA
jgi:long-subunit acyl-CoA synthetase (AMP-forming)